MFETAELGASIPKGEFKKKAELLRKELLDLQMELREVGEFPVIIVFGGVDGAGKGSTTNILNEWMDTRWLNTHAYGEVSEVERDRPEYWRFWRDLPPKGQIGIYLSSWYSQPILDHVYGKIKDEAFSSALDRIAIFENTLADDGAVVLKFWMHLSKPAQKRRLKSLENDPLTKWQVSKRDWKHVDMYQQFVDTAERTIMRTNTGAAPWQIVEGEDYAYRSLQVGVAVRDALRKKLEASRVQREVKRRLLASQNESSAKPETVEPAADQPAPAEETVESATKQQPTVLSALDMSKKLAKGEYGPRLGELQARVGYLFREATKRGISTIALFEGPDAGGKGGAIRRITSPLDARNYKVLGVAAPTDEENAQHYLWRFWRQLFLLSRAGRLTIFDRSWYGRVLVERIEGFATEEEWRNRDKWEEYQLAVHDMIQYTSTVRTPWTLIEGNNKQYARIKVLETLAPRLEEIIEKK